MEWIRPAVDVDLWLGLLLTAMNFLPP